ncbi:MULTISPECIES: VWA domain-containing protein [Streptomyces]|uniref:VWA domain-containing protein n=1 Tax=Streptomyces siderophoricus TaxID=2802281 RepID=A0ABS1MTM1_9ACTN|nr:VWA domain-containing protein [Streptomyces sp. 9-7]MBL1091122.1 VWA domain-containing protein [Streptomyces sp. 9-7]
MGTVRGRRRNGRGWARRGAVRVLGGAAVLISLLAPAAHDPVPAAASKPAFKSVNYAVAVDESASLAADDMTAEKAAAARIALGDVSSASHVTVFGFAAAESNDQRAVDPVCPRTTLDAAGRDSIGGCVGKLRSRRKSEGTGTDFPSAIRQGVHELSSGTDPSVPRVLFLLTDGQMDVTGSPQYGDPAHRKDEGERQLDQELKNARAQGVQIWPLGFGPDPDKEQLDKMAAGGYQKGCVELPSASPKADKVSGAKDLGPKLEKIFAAAHCLRYQPGTSPQRPPATMEVGISPLATVGSIVVDKSDPKVTITYIDPNGHQVPTTGSYRKSHFELAGAGDTVEALKIVDPVPGVWQVKAEAPEGHRSLPVGVSVLWQGELRGAITMDPPSPQAGQKATVTMRLQTREGYQIKDPRDYAGLRVRSELTGDGFAAVPVQLTDDGKGPDPTASDGSFTGSVTIPHGADGALKVSGTLTASGLSADTRSESGLVAPDVLPVSGTLRLPAADAHPGDEVTGTLSVHNTGRTPHTLRLSVADLQPGLVSVSPAEIELKPDDSGTKTVTVRLGPADAFGDRLDDDGLKLGGTVTAVDTTDHDRTVVRSALSVTVTPEPGIWDAYWWAFLIAAAVLAAVVAAVLAWLRQRRGRRDPYGLMLQLVSEDGDVVATHPAGHGHKQWYEFAVVEPHRSPRIERRNHGRYAIQRSPEGGAWLRERGAGRTRLPANGTVPLSDGLSLSLGEETRSATSRRTRPTWGSRARTGTTSTTPTVSTEDDGTSTYESYR